MQLVKFILCGASSTSLDLSVHVVAEDGSSNFLNDVPTFFLVTRLKARIRVLWFEESAERQEIWRRAQLFLQLSSESASRRTKLEEEEELDQVV